MKKRDPWLILLWIAVGIAGSITLVVFITGIPLYYRHVSTICTTDCGDERLSAMAASQWENAGLSLSLYAAVTLGLMLALALVCFTVALLLLWRRPNDRMAVFTALLLILLGGTFGGGDEQVGKLVPWLGGIIEVINQAGFGLFPILFFTFPDGKFIPRWTLWVGLVMLSIALSIMSFIPIKIPVSYVNVLLPIWALMGPAAQIYRYKKVSNPLQRQQTKWIALGLGLGITGFISLALVGIAIGVPDRASPFISAAISTIIYVFTSLIPISIGIGILRYRLWDIDLIIRKTLVYGLLTTALALLYFGLVTLFQTISTSVFGLQSPVIIVISTLVIAALFNPLRNRIQSAIDRRFYRQKYNAERALAHFAEAARNETDIECLTTAMLDVVQETVQPETISLWIRKPR